MIGKQGRGGWQSEKKFVFNFVSQKLIQLNAHKMVINLHIFCSFSSHSLTFLLSTSFNLIVKPVVKKNKSSISFYIINYHFQSSFFFLNTFLTTQLVATSKRLVNFKNCIIQMTIVYYLISVYLEWTLASLSCFCC